MQPNANKYQWPPGAQHAEREKERAAEAGKAKKARGENNVDAW